MSLLAERRLLRAAAAVEVGLFTGTDCPGRRVQGGTGRYLLMRAVCWAAEHGSPGGDRCFDALCARGNDLTGEPAGSRGVRLEREQEHLDARSMKKVQGRSTTR